MAPSPWPPRPDAADEIAYRAGGRPLALAAARLVTASDPGVAGDLEALAARLAPTLPFATRRDVLVTRIEQAIRSATCWEPCYEGSESVSHG